MSATISKCVSLSLDVLHSMFMHFNVENFIVFHKLKWIHLLLLHYTSSIPSSSYFLLLKQASIFIPILLIGLMTWAYFWAKQKTIKRRQYCLISGWNWRTRNKKLHFKKLHNSKWSQNSEWKRYGQFKMTICHRWMR